MPSMWLQHWCLWLAHKFCVWSIQLDFPLLTLSSNSFIKQTYIYIFFFNSYCKNMTSMHANPSYILIWYNLFQATHALQEFSHPVVLLWKVWCDDYVVVILCVCVCVCVYVGERKREREREYMCDVFYILLSLKLSSY